MTEWLTYTGLLIQLIYLSMFMLFIEKKLGLVQYV